MPRAHLDWVRTDIQGMGFFESSVKPAPPGPGAKTARLTTKEEECGPPNASFASYLESIVSKGTLNRFLSHLRDDPGKNDGEELTEEDLDRFLRALDDKLVPPMLGDDRVLTRAWRQFWAKRNEAWTIVRTRIKEERKKSAEPDGAEAALERSIVRALLRADRQHLRTFVGRRNVDVEDLTMALWRSHADGWTKLAAEPSVSAALNVLPEVALMKDAVERTRSTTGRFTAFTGSGPSAAAWSSGQARGSERGRPPERSGLKPHEVLRLDPAAKKR